MRLQVVAATTALTVTLSCTTAQAFCGFYVSGSDKKMFADATNVVLMRSGTRTVLAMQNDYRGPLEDFAMVVPVPVVLKEGDVKVLSKAVLDRIDTLSAPRLVEYWEQDPCPPPVPKYDRMRVRRMQVLKSAPMTMGGGGGGGGGGVAYDVPEPKPVAPVLASFSVYPPSITAGAATNVTWSYHYANQPYPEPSCTVDHGIGNVSTGMASPLELQHSTTFTLTCQNSAGRSQKQARVNVVKIEAKFDVAEYQIVILSAAEATGLDQWLKLNGYKIPAGAEPLLRPYVEAGSKFFVAKVDPKKVQMIDGRAALSPLRFHYDSDEFSLPIRLGMANSSGKQDLIVNIISDRRYEVANYKNITIPTNFDVKVTVKERFAEFYAALFDKTLERNPGAVVTEYAWAASPSMGKCDPCPPEPPVDQDMLAVGADVISGPISQGTYTLTRLHARYGKRDLKDDLRFKEASPITGGREVWSRAGLEYGAQPSQHGQNNFQARYAIRYWWTGPIRCTNPRRGQWGGPPYGAPQMIAATKTAFAPRGRLRLASVIKRDLWEIGFKRAVPPAKAAPPTQPKTMYFGAGVLGGLLLLGIGAFVRRRKGA